MNIGNLEESLKSYIGKLGIAPDSLIEQDFISYNPSLKVSNKSSNVADILKALSMVGRAQSGINGVYNGRKFPDTTICDVLKFFPDHTIRSKATRYIKEYFRYNRHLLNIISGKVGYQESYLYDENNSSLKIENEKGNPLFGLSFFSDYRIRNPVFFIMGSYATTNIDSAEYRKKTIEKFKESLNGSNFKLGYGTCFVANDELLKEKGFGISRFSYRETSKEIIDLLHQRGIFLDNNDPFSEIIDDNEINVYAREKSGLGICDDATILIASIWIKKQFGLDNAIDFYLGCVGSDTVDSFDKISDTNIKGGLDEYLGREQKQFYLKHFGIEPFSDDNIEKMIYMGAKGNKPRINFSSSVKYFNLTQNIGDAIKVAHQAHLMFLREEKITQGMLFGFQQFNSENFYNIIIDRLKLAEEKGMNFEF